MAIIQFGDGPFQSALEISDSASIEFVGSTTTTDVQVGYVNGGDLGNVAVVIVVTGEETRPGAVCVLWIGGSTQPTHMTPADVWFKSA